MCLTSSSHTQQYIRGPQDAEYKLAGLIKQVACHPRCLDTVVPMNTVAFDH